MVEIWKYKKANALILHSEQEYPDSHYGIIMKKDIYEVWVNGNKKGNFLKLKDAFESLKRSYPHAHIPMITDLHFEYKDYCYSRDDKEAGTFMGECKDGDITGQMWLEAGDYENPPHNEKWEV